MTNALNNNSMQRLKSEIPEIMEQIDNNPKKEIWISIKDVRNTLGIDKNINNKLFSWELLYFLFENGIYGREDELYKDDIERKKPCFVLRRKKLNELLDKKWNLVPVLLTNSISKNWYSAKEEWKLQRVYAEENGTCACDHYPITIRVVVKNNKNDNELTLGSECFKRVLTDEDLKIVKQRIKAIRNELGSQYDLDIEYLE